jgi:ParB family chromosome partitioning protein
MQTDQEQRMVAPAMLRPGKNPRRHFDSAFMAELESSVKVQGVIQPLLVRPLDDGTLEIVAGERRWRAATAVGLTEIPVLIKTLSDEEAKAHALVENVQRANMNPAEEAEAASEILGLCGGDRAEAARRLGWNVQTMDKRLGLMNCTKAVREALIEGKINLGHAELIAGLAKEKQDPIMLAMLSKDKLPTVAELKASIAAKACAMSAAIFDKSECAACPHNSTTQAALFGEAVADGYCTNRDCFAGKEMEKLEQIKGDLKDDYPEVRFVRPGDNATVLKLRADGPDGVGVEQAAECRACAKFGAAVSMLPGKTGTVFKDLCFDPACNAAKIKARLKAEADAAAAMKAKAAAEAAGASSISVGSATPAAAGTKPKAKADGKAEAKATSVQDGPKLKEYRLKIWRTALGKHLVMYPDQNRFALLAIGLCDFGRNISGSKMREVFGKLTGTQHMTGHNFGQAMETLMAAPQDVVEKMHLLVAASVAGGVEESRVTDMMKTLGVDISVTWTINAEYLELLSKSEIEYVCDQIGLKAHLGKGFSKAMAGKKAEIIKSLLATEGFEFKGKVPSHMQPK